MNITELARKHAIRYDRPAPSFFEGALLGNGGLGAVVTTRPDAVVIHFGHNNVWDIRIAEKHQDEIGTFEALFARLQDIPEYYSSLSEEPWYKEYVAMTSENYDFPYPRPMPCGSLLLGFDRRTTEVLGHKLWIDNGPCEVYFLAGSEEVTLRLFVDQQSDRLWATVNGTDSGTAGKTIFNRMKWIPDPETPAELPKFESWEDPGTGQRSFRQRLPLSLEGASSRDKAFRMTASLGEAGFLLCVTLEEGLEADVPAVGEIKVSPGDKDYGAAFEGAVLSWDRYWSRSGVSLADEFLEQIWYRNLYFFHCSVKPEATCPGIFANWSYGKIGSEWHGDYHMNYNTQQPFWLAFSSNHVDKHLRLREYGGSRASRQPEVG